MSEAQLPPVPDGFFWRIKHVEESYDWCSEEHVAVRLMETVTKRTLFGNTKTVFKSVGGATMGYDHFAKLSHAEKRESIADAAQRIMDKLNGEAEAETFFGDYPPKKL